MSRLDDRISRELERVARPADPAGAFDRVDRRRHNRHVMHRIQAASLIVVVLAGTVGGVLVLTKAFRPAAAPGGSRGTISAPTPTPSSSPAPSATAAGPIDLGLGFPVCDPRTMTADMDGNGTLDTVTVATKMSDTSECPARGTTTEIVAFDMNGDGKSEAVGGPLSCPTGCEPFAAPDLDADGHPDLALSVDQRADGTQRIELFRVVGAHGGSDAMSVVPFTDPAGDPPTFAWGADPAGIIAGVSCTSRITPPLVTAWQATPTTTGFTVAEHGYHVVDTTLRTAFQDHYDVPGEETSFPDGGGSTMCGAPVSTPGTATTVGSALPSPTPSVDIPVDLGLGFPVCNVHPIQGDFDGNGTMDSAYVATKMGDAPCPSQDHADNIIGVDTDGDGHVDSTMGPTGCTPWCLPYAAPDLNGDGRDELVLNMGHLASPVSAALSVYELSGPTLAAFRFPGGSSSFDVNDSGSTYLAGAFCSTDGADQPLFTVWEAPTSDGGATYDFVERNYRVNVQALRFQPNGSAHDTLTSSSPWPENPAQTNELCGAPAAPLG